MNRILSYKREAQLITYVIWLIDTNNQTIEPIQTTSSTFPIIFRKKRELFDKDIAGNGLQYICNGA